MIDLGGRKIGRHHQRPRDEVDLGLQRASRLQVSGHEGG